MLSDMFKRGKTLRNYIVPGLTSTLLGTNADGGIIRLFEMSRDQEMYVTPHDHDYDFACRVERGSVVNMMYRPTANKSDDPTHAVAEYDPRWRSILITGDRFSMRRDVHTYREGDEYSMKFNEFHSILFHRGARVLFIEGARKKQSTTRVLLPLVDGVVCDTFFNRPWMMEPA